MFSPQDLAVLLFTGIAAIGLSAIIAVYAKKAKYDETKRNLYLMGTIVFAVGAALLAVFLDLMINANIKPAPPNAVKVVEIPHPGDGIEEPNGPNGAFLPITIGNRTFIHLGLYSTSTEEFNDNAQKVEEAVNRFKLDHPDLEIISWNLQTDTPITPDGSVVSHMYIYGVWISHKLKNEPQLPAYLQDATPAPR